LDEFAGAWDKVFGDNADPQDLNDFFRAIGLRITFDPEASCAQVEASFQQPDEAPNQPSDLLGVSERVRGGTWTLTPISTTLDLTA
jgi:hypothetical protein